QPLKTMSTGEQKKALLNYLLRQEPDFLVLVNPFDNLDVATQAQRRENLCDIAASKTMVQLVSRLDDILPITTDFFTLDGNVLQKYPTAEAFWEANRKDRTTFHGVIPPPIETIETVDGELVKFNKVS